MKGLGRENKMLEVYSYFIQVFILALIGFLFGLGLKDKFKIDFYSAISIMVILTGLLIFLLQITINHYFELNINLVKDFPDYLAKQFGGFILVLFFGAIYKKLRGLGNE